MHGAQQRLPTVCLVQEPGTRLECRIAIDYGVSRTASGACHRHRSVALRDQRHRIAWLVSRRGNHQIGGIDDVIARYHRWYVNNFGAISTLNTLDEWWNVGVSADGGASWTPVENRIEGEQAWIEVEVDLGALFGPVDSVQFRFVARDTGEATRVHAAVDEIRLPLPEATGIAIAAHTKPPMTHGLPSQ